jgi:hypothetical protein
MAVAGAFQDRKLTNLLPMPPGFAPPFAPLALRTFDLL